MAVDTVSGDRWCLEECISNLPLPWCLVLELEVS